METHGKRQGSVYGIVVLGSGSDNSSPFENLAVERIVIAIPTSFERTVEEIAALSQACAAEVKAHPALVQILDGKRTAGELPGVRVEDLLQRKPVQTDTRGVRQLLHGRRVLVTGGGGSIGSELCRQIARYRPAQLLILGHGENTVFTICQELCRGDQTLSLVPVIADIRSPDRLRAIFHCYRPEVVFHTAGHKHVPLMEYNPAEAVTNNVLGTLHLLQVSLNAGVERFVMISTDKAVNPTSLMGASKRVAEMLVHQTAAMRQRPYVVVRFGNVLGSRGSVLFTFEQQIAAGGPVTVTDPEMERYFMTIPEAVQLVLQAAVLGRGNEVFVLDMGSRVKILDLAHDLIRRAGFEVGRDVEIVFTGRRPGEKLCEELFLPGEKYERTCHEKIYLAADAGCLIPNRFDTNLQSLLMAAHRNDRAAIIRAFQTLLPNFTPASPTAGAALRRAAPLAPPSPPAKAVGRNGQLDAKPTSKE